MTLNCKFLRYFALLIFIFLAAASSQDDMLNSGGLKFSSKQVYSSQRTSFKLFNESKHTSKSFNLKFNCQIYDQKLFGFVFRVIDASQTSSSPLMNLLFIPFQGNTGKCAFELHFNNTQKTIRFDIDTLQLSQLSFTIEAFIRDNRIVISCNNDTRETTFQFPKNPNINFIFGLYGENTDVAPMILQNVRLSLNDQVNYQWPLNELNGNIAHEKLNNLESEVNNPNWMQDKHYYWEKVYSGASDPMAGIVMDKNNKILILNKDSLIICDPHEQTIKVTNYATIRPFDKDAFFAIYNPKEDVVIAYDFHFLKVNDGRRLYSVYNPVTNSWTATDSAEILDQNHHHCIFWNNDTSKVITFGGYSYFHYYNNFKAFDFNTRHWEEIKLSGDEIFPRTHSVVNRNRYTGEYFVFGGFGNKEGSQSLEGKYFYDLYKINPKDRVIKKIWNINSPGFDFVPRGTLIFRPDVPLAYVLGNKPIEKSNLRLYEINLEEPAIKAVSDSIPVIFSDMSGNAFLFHNRIQNELYCVTRETTQQPNSVITVYRLMFPPSEIAPSLQNVSEKKHVYIYVLTVSVTLLIIGTLFFIRRKTGKSLIPVKTEVPEKFERKTRNAIWLLNNFRVYDRSGHEITYRFATKIRHAFIILFMENYFKNGIPSSDFSDLLWPSLNKNQQKNNRGVVMNNLRKIFEDLEGITLFKDEMHWKISFTDEVFIDFIEVHKLMAKPMDEQNKEMILNYLSLGNLLMHENWDYIDDYKDRYSTAAIDVLLEMDRNAFHSHHYMKSIEISDVVLNHFDFLNDQAMIYKIKSLYILKNNSRAVAEFNKFRLKYNESISKNFHMSFDEIIKLPENFENHLR